MAWDRIRIFLAVARSGQISGAAKGLGLNHATVGRQLTALEAELGRRPGVARHLLLQSETRLADVRAAWTGEIAT